jgi:iron complex transport system ATP-binding protein
MLKADHISFSYEHGRRERRLVLDDVSLSVERGDIVGLLGPNGSGKTTLLGTIAGLLKPERGEVRFYGQPVQSLSRRELARHLAVVPQDTHAAFEFTVRDIVLMGRYPHLGPLTLEGPADVEIARQALEATGYSALESRLFGTLSGGERQRVIIASALAQASDALLLDEPTASLDLGAQCEIMSLVTRLNRDRGTTIIVSTHDLNFAAAVCHRIVLLKAGRVVAQGPTIETLTSAHVRSLYGVEADVQFHKAAGHVTVVPIARSR